MVPVWCEGGFVDEGGVTAELLQRFTRFEAVNSEMDRKCLLGEFDRWTSRRLHGRFWLLSPDGLVEGGAEELAAVFTESDTRHAFTVGAFEPPQTLAALDLPHLHTQTHHQPEEGLLPLFDAGSQWLMKELIFDCDKRSIVATLKLKLFWRY